MDSVLNYKCNNCGAPLAFSIETQRWDCKFCNSSFSAEQLNSFEEQEGATNNPETFTQADVTVFNCPSCGGQVITDINTAAAFCPYCNNSAIVKSKVSGEMRPEKIIPFQKSKEDVLQELKNLCRSKVLLPKEFTKAVENGEITGLYVPFWLFSEEYTSHVKGTATVIKTWSDSKYRYRQTDTYSIERAASMRFELVPVDASMRLDDDLMDAIEPFKMTGLVKFKMPYLSGHLAEAYDVDAEKCSQRFRKRADKSVNETMENLISGYTSFRIYSSDTKNSNLETTYAMFPVWFMNVTFKGENYQYAMNGQTGKAVGVLPISQSRALSLFGILTGVLSIIVALVRIFLL